MVPLLLALAANAEGTACWLSQPELAEQLAIHVSNVRRQEQTLATLGLVRIVRGGPNNRRLIVLEDLDAQVVAGVRRKADAQPGEVLNTDSTSLPHSTAETVHKRAVSSERQTAHKAPSHKKLASARARAEEPWSDSSARAPAAAPWPVWARAKSRRSCLPPEWPGPSQAVDDRASEAHQRLGCFENTLRQTVIAARDHCRKHGEAETLRYIDNLERWCRLSKSVKKPAGAFYRGMQKWVARIEGAAPMPRQHVLEDVGPAKHLGGLLDGFLPREVRHA